MEVAILMEVCESSGDFEEDGFDLIFSEGAVAFECSGVDFIEIAVEVVEH